MTDFRRTLLWVVFSMSLVLIWDAWQRHNGQPSMFGPAPAKPAAAGASAAPGAVPSPALPASATAPAAAPGALPGTAAAPAAAASVPVAKQVTVATDLVKATLDSTGGSLVRLELLKQADQNDRSKNIVLFDK